MNLNAGDVVKLKSDGPRMTIEKIGPRSSTNGEDVAHCVWFDKDDQVKEGQFIPATLITVPEK